MSIDKNFPQVAGDSFSHALTQIASFMKKIIQED
jgi:hypothetical protein